MFSLWRPLVFVGVVASHLRPQLGRKFVPAMFFSWEVKVPAWDRPRFDNSVGMRCQTACKPGSVPAEAGDDHSSGTLVAERLARPTRAATRKQACAVFRRQRAAPTWSCSRWGLPCRFRYRKRGALLPHLFTLASGRSRLAVCFLWHCPWGRPRRTLSGTVFPWSPDFPPPAPKSAKGGHPAVWHIQ